MFLVFFVLLKKKHAKQYVAKIIELKYRNIEYAYAY